MKMIIMMMNCNFRHALDVKNTVKCVKESLQRLIWSAHWIVIPLINYWVNCSVKTFLVDLSNLQVFFFFLRTKELHISPDFHTTLNLPVSAHNCSCQVKFVSLEHCVTWRWFLCLGATTWQKIVDISGIVMMEVELSVRIESYIMVLGGTFNI